MCTNAAILPSQTPVPPTLTQRENRPTTIVTHTLGWHKADPLARWQASDEISLGKTYEGHYSGDQHLEDRARGQGSFHCHSCSLAGRPYGHLSGTFLVDGPQTPPYSVDKFQVALLRSLRVVCRCETGYDEPVKRRPSSFGVAFYSWVTESGFIEPICECGSEEVGSLCGQETKRLSLPKCV